MIRDSVAGTALIPGMRVMRSGLRVGSHFLSEAIFQSFENCFFKWCEEEEGGVLTMHF